jgi:glycosyltransferase involved in cell wall biosynthesis
VSGLKVSIGLLLSNGFPVPVPFVLGLMELQHAILTGETNADLRALRGANGKPPDVIDELRVINSQGFPIDTARNEVVRTFLDDHGGDWLLFLDADMRHPRNLLARLLAANRVIVSARYQMRREPFHTVAMRKAGPGRHDYKAIEEQSGLVEVDAVGAGALLIHRSVLEALRHHGPDLGVAAAHLQVTRGWNSYESDDWFRYQEGPKGLRTVSEDMWFCERAKAAGFKIWCDLDTVCSHVAQFEVTPAWNLPFRDAAAKVAEKGAARSVLLPGEVQP